MWVCRNGKRSDAQDIVCTIRNYGEYDNHSIAYCLIGYLCAYLRYYHPYEFITCYLNNAESDEDIKKGTELAEAYGIRITPPRYGVSKDEYHFSAELKTIAKGVSSIKYLSSKAASELYNIAEALRPKTFTELLLCLKETSINSRQVDMLLKIDFFETFGNIRELSRIREMFEFFKEGDVKSIKKARITDPTLKEIIEQHTSSTKKDGSEALSYTFRSENDVVACMFECEKVIRDLHLPDLDLRTKIQNCLDVLGYVDIATGREEDRKRLLITDCSPIQDKTTGEAWGYRVSTRSLGSGKTSRITVYADIYKQKPFVAGDIVYCDTVYKNKSGYWYMSSYRIE